MSLNWLCRMPAHTLGTFVLTIFLYGAWLLCRIFLFDQFVIPTDSMYPTLIPGDRVIVKKTIMGARIYTDFNFIPEGGELKCWRTRGRRKVMHNDILVFNFPHHDWKISFVINNVFCKRCIALPGDTIWSEDGYYRNNNYPGILGIEGEQLRFSSIPDSLLPHEVLDAYPFDPHIPHNNKNLQRIYVPRRGDVIKVTPREACFYKLPLEWETGKAISCDWDKGEVYADGELLSRHIFAHNYYFMAGDNVMNSSDSRGWGLVPEEYIVGVVTHISYSRDKNTHELSSERIWQKV